MLIKYAILGNNFLMHQEFPQNMKTHFKYEWRGDTLQCPEALYTLLSQKDVTKCTVLPTRICEVVVSDLGKETAYLKF